MNKKLLIATTNQGKVNEYRDLLEGLPFELVSLLDMGISTEVDETGFSYEENACLKATVLAAESGLLTLADDSGLEVDALDGEPGVRSARYAGEGASDLDRIDYLLEKLKDVPWEKRSAHFKCVIAVAAPGEEVETCTGDCSGFITLEPRGKYGHGYDPIFFLPGLDNTMAELPREQKNQLSHRGLAAEKALKILGKKIQGLKKIGK